ILKGSQERDYLVRQVTLTRTKSHEGLGFSIRGGSEHGVGIYVSLVEPGSSAEREGLRVGDQIVTVNDMIFITISHDEAVHILKTGCHLLMRVRDFFADDSHKNTRRSDHPALLI
uniref:Whirlin n=1 Tax=Myripristis murdjan TaxID=586833 RepID=A0A667XKU8_9TELE